MSPHTSSMQRLTQLLLAILAVGVWGLLLRPYLPIAAAAAKPPSEPRRHLSIRLQYNASMSPMPTGLRAWSLPIALGFPEPSFTAKNIREASMTRRVCYSWIRRARRPAASRCRNCATTTWRP